MNTLDLVHPIRQDRLNPQYYFQSLMEQAVGAGILNSNDLAQLQTRLLQLLAAQTDALTKGESSSIRSETAQELLASILFVIGLKLKTFPSPEQAAEALKHTPLQELFQAGMQLVKRKLRFCRSLHHHLTDQLFSTPNVYYRSTVVDGVNGFFRLYHPAFFAHRLHITADYPVYAGRPPLDGVEFIEQYLRHVQAENDFLGLFDPQDVHHLLCGLTPDYVRIPMNLFEPVLLSALGLILVGRSAQRLDLTKQELLALETQLDEKSLEQLESMLDRAFTGLERFLPVSRRTKQYYILCRSKLALSLQHASQLHRLDQIFLIPEYPEQRPQAFLSYGERMDDQNYRKLLEQISLAGSCESQVDLILTKVHSLADLLDLISNASLEPAAFALLTQRLPLPVFAALLFHFPERDLLEQENELILFDALQQKKQRLSCEDQQLLQEMLHSLQNGERNRAWGNLKGN